MNSVNGGIDISTSDQLINNHDDNFHTKFCDHIFNEGGRIPHNENINSNEDVVKEKMIEEVHKQNPMSRIKCRTRPFYVNPKHSSYTRSKK